MRLGLSLTFPEGPLVMFSLLLALPIFVTSLFPIYFDQILVAPTYAQDLLPEQNLSWEIQDKHFSSYQFEFCNSLLHENDERDANLDQLYERLTELERLPYDNTEIYAWENDVQILLKSKLGDDSQCYKQFKQMMQQGFWRLGAIDRRAIVVSPEFYQQEYVDQLQEYRFILTRCMESMN